MPAETCRIKATHRPIAVKGDKIQLALSAQESKESPTGILSPNAAAGAGANRGRENVVYIRGKSVHVDSPEKIPLQIDGEAAGFTPLQVDILLAPISFLVPAHI